MNDYIFTKNSEDAEKARLQMIEAACDPATISLLEQSGVQPGWRCLELGPGAGSIMRWLGARVGATGRVIGIDKNSSYLGDLTGSPYSLIEGDITETELPLTFDLIHGRYVLIHTKDTDSILKKLRKALAPGGLIVLEEPDFTSAHRLNPTSNASVQKVNAAICRMFSNFGLDPGYALTLPARLEAQGFAIDSVNSNLHFAPGGTPIARLMGESARVLHQEYTATGEADESDIEEYARFAADKTQWAVYYLTVSVIGSSGA